MIYVLAPVCIALVAARSTWDSYRSSGPRVPPRDAAGAVFDAMFDALLYGGMVSFVIWMVK